MNIAQIKDRKLKIERFMEQAIVRLLNESECTDIDVQIHKLRIKDNHDEHARLHSVKVQLDIKY